MITSNALVLLLFPMQRPLAHLPSETRNRLRSTQILTSLSQIVSELVQNSLDAGARAVDIGVDCEEWTCWVRDDGHGMSKDGMQILSQGSEEGRYGAWYNFNLNRGCLLTPN